VKKLSFILIAIFAVLVGLLVGTLNASPVQMDLLWVQFELPLGLALLLGFSMGILTGVVALYFARILPLRMQLRKARAQLSKPNKPTQQDSVELISSDD